MRRFGVGFELEEVLGGEGCWIRKHRDGTVARLSGSASVTKRRSGRVRDPPFRAETCT